MNKDSNYNSTYGDRFEFVCNIFENSVSKERERLERQGFQRHSFDKPLTLSLYLHSIHGVRQPNGLTYRLRNYHSLDYSPDMCKVQDLSFSLLEVKEVEREDELIKRVKKQRFKNDGKTYQEIIKFAFEESKQIFYPLLLVTYVREQWYKGECRITIDRDISFYETESNGLVGCLTRKALEGFARLEIKTSNPSDFETYAPAGYVPGKSKFDLGFGYLKVSDGTPPRATYRKFFDFFEEGNPLKTAFILGNVHILLSLLLVGIFFCLPIIFLIAYCAEWSILATSPFSNPMYLIVVFLFSVSGIATLIYRLSRSFDFQRRRLRDIKQNRSA
jgi:hypothetical protein